MPYARKAYRKRPYKRTGSAPAKRARPAVPVPRKKKTARTYTRTNSLALNKLTRQVRTLREQTYGNFQQNVRGTQDPLQIYKGFPLIVNMNDYTSNRSNNSVVPPIVSVGGRVFQVQAPVPPATDTTVQPVTHWIRSDFSDSLYLSGQNRAIVGDTGQYFALGNTTTLQFTVSSNASARPPRIRIDLFTFKPKGLIPNTWSDPTQGRNRTFPWCASQLTDMAALQNCYNSAYLKLLKTKTIVCNNDTALVSGGGVMVKEYRHTVSVKPHRLIKQTRPDPDIPGTTDPEIALGKYGPFNTSPLDACCLLISTDNEDNDVHIHVRMMSKVSWRDQVGSSGP